jgi:hypothetical protein
MYLRPVRTEREAVGPNGELHPPGGFAVRRSVQCASQ